MKWRSALVLFKEIVSHHVLAGPLRLESKTVLMSQIGLCAKKTLHSRTCHLSLMVRSKWVGHWQKKQTAEICKSSRPSENMFSANMVMWENQNWCVDVKRLHMECSSRCFVPRKDSVQSTLCKNPNLSAGSDMKNLLTSLGMSLSSNFAGSFPSCFGASEGMNKVKLTATCHSCTSTSMTLCARTFSGNCVSSRLGRVSATGKQGSPDVTDWTLRKKDSPQQVVSSLPSHVQIIACFLHMKMEEKTTKPNITQEEMEFVVSRSDT